MIPYRTRIILRKAGIAVLALAMIALVFLLCWFLWLNRYVIYTRTGALLDFGLSSEFSEGEQPKAPESGPKIEIYYNEGENMILPGSQELTQLSGIYVTESMLENSFEEVKSQLSVLQANVPVMLDVKNIRGEFFYFTDLGRNDSAIDPTQMTRLISDLKKTNHYLIARLPALRDYWFGLQNVNDGIFNPNRLSLWMDEEKCYWLNPKSQGTLSYLLQIVTELRDMGFDEVVFSDFSLPPTNNIYFEGDKVQAINDFAATLVKSCATEGFAVSFQRSSENFVLPDGRSRLYLENVGAADAAGVVEEMNLENSAGRLVFLTELMDTRFDEFSVLRPMQIAN